jgi:hypothetical protein
MRGVQDSNPNFTHTRGLKGIKKCPLKSFYWGCFWRRKGNNLILSYADAEEIIKAAPNRVKLSGYTYGIYRKDGTILYAEINSGTGYEYWSYWRRYGIPEPIPLPDFKKMLEKKVE